MIFSTFYVTYGTLFVFGLSEHFIFSKDQYYAVLFDSAAKFSLIFCFPLSGINCTSHQSPNIFNGSVISFGHYFDVFPTIPTFSLHNATMPDRAKRLFCHFCGASG
jgi:hypothetical protein